MADPFSELLDATIQHLENLKAHGERWVTLSPDLLRELGSTAGPAKKISRASKPISPRVETRTSPAPVTPAPAPATPAVAAQILAVPAPLAPVRISNPDSDAAFAALRTEVLACTKCPHLAQSRKNVVFGVGDIHAQLMFVGEAPGADEDLQGEPFVGAAGQLLTRIIKAMGFTRETVYIANVLKCRPDTPGQMSGNRKPTPEEMQTCLPYLRRQIDLIQPRVMVALGATAMEGLFGRVIGISKARGNWMSFNGIPVMPTFHPSYLLRNQAPAVKRQVWEDMLQVLEKLGMPTSEKQRNYFR